MDSHAFVWPLELGLRTPTLWCGPLSWGYGLPRFGGRERLAHDDSGAARHHTRPAVGDSGPPEAQIGEGESGTGSAAPEGDAARQRWRPRCHAAHSAGTGYDKAHLCAGGTNGFTRVEGADQGDREEGSTDDRYPTPTCGGRAPENGGETGIWPSPACSYSDGDLANTGMVQMAPATPPSQWPPAL